MQNITYSQQKMLRADFDDRTMHLFLFYFVFDKVSSLNLGTGQLLGAHIDILTLCDHKCDPIMSKIVKAYERT